MKVKKSITLYRGESENNYSNKFKPLAGLFFSPNVKGAKGWGSVVKYSLLPEANIFAYKSSGEYTTNNNFNDKEYPEVYALAKSLGLDFKSMNEFANNFEYYQENGLEDRLTKINRNAVGYDVFDWISQIISKIELKKQGFDGVKWELEDFGNPQQYQIWNMNVIKRINESMKVKRLLEVRKNTHQTHMESLVVLGENGLQELNNYIDKFLNMFEGDTSLNLTSKIDGAPSVYVWSKLDGYPDNSIALKSFVSGPKTAMSSEKEIDERYSDRPDMAEKLKQCLKLSKYIPQGEAWQGDCLFTKNDLKEEEINGVNYVIFHPNKIVYAFSEDNAGYNKIKNADLGIAFHTIYKVNNSNMSQSFKVDLSRLDAPNNFYLLSPAINVSKEKKDYNLNELNKEYSNLKSLEQTLLNDKNYEELINNKQFIDYWNMFENYALADKKQTNINVNTLMKDLKEFILDKKEKEYNKKQDTLKTDKGREKAKEKYNKDLLELEDLLNHNKSTIENLVKAINSAANIKMMLWNSLKNSKDDYSTFYKSKSQGYIPANKEGIAMSDENGNIVKIVDRSEFSSNNRNQDFESGFAHESFGVATQGGDMGSFKSFTKVLKNEKLTEAVDKVAIVAGGRMNPPTTGHQKVVDLLASIGNKYNTKPKLFLTHTSGDEKNPLSYESKIRWVEKAFGDKVDVVKTNTTKILEYLSELYNEGYNKLIYVAGGERKEEFESLINKYNGIPDKSGRVLFNFDDVKVEQAGIRDEDNNVSATMVRKFAKEKNFDEFKKYVPFNEQDAKNLFDELRYALKDSKNFVEKYLKEANFSANDIIKHNYYNDVINDLEKGEFEDEDGNDIVLDAKTIKDLRKLNSITNHIEKKDKFEEISGLKWSSIDKSPYSGMGSLKGSNDLGINGKSFTPNQVVKDIGIDIPYNKMPKEIYYQNNKTIENMLVKVVDDTLNTSTLTKGNEIVNYLIGKSDTSPVNEFELSCKYDIKKYIKELGEDNFKSMISPFKNNFGEVFGATALAKVLGNTAINFPKASNEPLVDYFIKSKGNDEFKVSAKSGSGGQPAMSEPLIKVYENTKNKNSRFGKFIKWMYENVATKDIHEGFINLANLVVNKPDWFTIDSNAKSIPQKYLKGVNISGKDGYEDIEALYKLMKELGYQAGNINKLSQIKDKKDLQTYLETLRVRVLSHVAIKSINEDTELIDAFNMELNKVFGTFIQIYLLENNSDFINGDIKFKSKVVSINGEPISTNTPHKYYFSDSSSIGSNLKIGNKRLSMVLK